MTSESHANTRRRLSYHRGFEDGRRGNDKNPSQYSNNGKTELDRECFRIYEQGYIEGFHGKDEEINPYDKR